MRLNPGLHPGLSHFGPSAREVRMRFQFCSVCLLHGAVARDASQRAQIGKKVMNCGTRLLIEIKSVASVRIRFSLRTQSPNQNKSCTCNHG